MAHPRIIPIILLAFALYSKVLGQTDDPSGTQTPIPVFYLYDLANQTQEDITTVLGPQSSLNAADAQAAICANCQKYAYQNDRIVIEYTNDMADRITIRPSARIKAEQVPALLGLPEAVPDFASEDKMQWTGYEGIREVNAFLEKDGSVRLILVKVLTL